MFERGVIAFSNPPASIFNEPTGVLAELPRAQVS
jgi:hypothetical protein